jgi:Ca-activated chloride channel family protein
MSAKTPNKTSNKIAKSLRLLSSCALASLVLAGAAHAAVAPRIVSPAPDQPVFGQTEVTVQVQANEPVARVEFYLNGRRVAVVTEPPYRAVLETGDDNVAREFKVIAFGASGASGQATVATQPVRVDDQVEVNLRQLYVTVTRSGADTRILDLDQNDFQVYDNGKPQEIATFGKGEVPITAVLLLDTSESMKGPRLEAARRGASAFLSGMRPDDEASLVLFSDRLLSATPFTDNRKVLEKAFAETEASGGTAVNDFLYLALKRLDSRIGRRAVVLLSDGADVHSVLRMEEVLFKARTSQSLIYWIQLEGGEKHKSFNSAWRDFHDNDREYEMLRKTVIESGGRILPIDRDDQLEGAFSSIIREMREQYVLGYYPTDTRHDGKWHPIRVDVKGGGIRVRTRDGYVAD